ncbi:pentapeptide repeat-containing protein [Fertoebacter nigrum]|uniref:Pentapeptide repeat-containing protein n=1 Tax=Fertoeibacter niger TaxID=2656921 RepID=A0A8X8H038_9RHOB|nr:pentapeptide repeat-containing protein [Fertoeibacter niger]NUB44485.1 pentapeptide repeat-containing protein [Fertoeibacter niger]
MEPAEHSPPPEPRVPSGVGGSAAMSILVFGFGIAAGILIAFSGFGFLEDSAAVIVVVFLSALCVVTLLGMLLFILRRPLLRRVFGHAETQLESFARPLAKVAERAIERDPSGATDAARDLVSLVLARYSWVAMRRWVIASLTALIAAMAALAGTALLFKQNQLLEEQSDLLEEQNVRIQEQTTLLTQDVQLAEASRNAALAVEITSIAAALGEHIDTANAALQAETGQKSPNLFNVIFAEDLSSALMLRITSLSRATQPYRYLDLGVRTQDYSDKMRQAMKRRRADLPDTYARMADYYGWKEDGPENILVDRPASPERGQLLSVLMGAGLRNLEPLNFIGLDLSFAVMADAEIQLLTAMGGRLSYADFSGSYITGADLGGAMLENARFRSSTIKSSTFAAVTAERVRDPYLAESAPYSTFLSGADFSGSTIFDTDFSNATMLAANLDGALLLRANFAGATLAAATLRGAVLLAPDFTGADMKSADLDGAVVFGESFLADLAAKAAPGSFLPERYRMEPLPRADLMAINIVYLTLYESDVDAATDSAPAFRLVRIQPFD